MHECERYPSHMLYLASQSPRRHDLLAKLGMAFSVLSLDVEEIRNASESPQQYIERVSYEKAAAGLAAVRAADSNACIIAADTDVVVADQVMGKPSDEKQAIAMLSALQGREHHVITSVCVINQDKQHQILHRSTVEFAPLTQRDIDFYIATGEWRGKAGGYAIQGYGEALIKTINGSYSSIMGLPLFETRQLLQHFGYTSDLRKLGIAGELANE